MPLVVSLRRPSSAYSMPEFNLCKILNLVPKTVLCSASLVQSVIEVYEMFGST